jgi:creatinine amidohydrolase
MSSHELGRLMKDGTTSVVIPFGSVEAQGAHLPVGADAFVADVVGQSVAERLRAVLAPTVRVGFAEQHLGAVGTLSVPAETLHALAFHTSSSLLTHGFRLVVLISAHGGNDAVLAQTAEDLSDQYADAVVCAPRGDVGADPGQHSGRWLTSVMLAIRPDLVNLGSADPDLLDEVMGSTPETGAENLERFVRSIVRAVAEIA